MQGKVSNVRCKKSGCPSELLLRHEFKFVWKTIVWRLARCVPWVWGSWKCCLATRCKCAPSKRYAYNWFRNEGCLPPQLHISRTGELTVGRMCGGDFLIYSVYGDSLSSKYIPVAITPEVSEEPWSSEKYHIHFHKAKLWSSDIDCIQSTTSSDADLSNIFIQVNIHNTVLTSVSISLFTGGPGSFQAPC